VLIDDMPRAEGSDVKNPLQLGVDGIPTPPRTGCQPAPTRVETIGEFLLNRTSLRRFGLVLRADFDPAEPVSDASPFLIGLIEAFVPTVVSPPALESGPGNVLLAHACLLKYTIVATL
jgi:hypothetical protein